MHESTFAGITKVLVASDARSCTRLDSTVDLRGMGYYHQATDAALTDMARNGGGRTYGNFPDLVSQAP